MGKGGFGRKSTGIIQLQLQCKQGSLKRFNCPVLAKGGLENADHHRVSLGGNS
jgi:hypothetical protein